MSDSNLSTTKTLIIQEMQLFKKYKVQWFTTQLTSQPNNRTSGNTGKKHDKDQHKLSLSKRV